MRVYCRTNLDLSNERWPDELPCLPPIGSHIQSMTKHGTFQLELQVVAITFKYSEHRQIWIPEIELHMTEWQRSITPKSNPDGDIAKGSITAFYQWYAPLVGRNVGAFI